MQKFLFLAVFLAGCGTESAYGQPAWTTGADASSDAEASTDSATDTGHDAADSRADTATDAAADTQARVCEPGKQEACACVGGSLGAQRCADDGMLWEACSCPDAASDSAIDAAADTSADSGTDSAMDAPVDTGTDSGSAVDSGGADAMGEAGPVECPGGRFVVLESGLPPALACALFDGSGRVLDRKTGATWTRIHYAQKQDGGFQGLTYSEAGAYCKSIGMRVPNVEDVVMIWDANWDLCAFPCHWRTWTTATGPGPSQAVMQAIGDTVWVPTNQRASVLCVKP